MYDDENLAEVYDLVYAVADGKDYRSEAHDLAKLIRQRHPHATSLLDVACGTGLHLSYLSGMFEHVEGVEISDVMREQAKSRLDGVVVHPGDMRDFHLDRLFGAVTCLFSAIGFMESVEELHQACARMAAHVEPGGVLLVEPWHTPEWQPVGINLSTGVDGDRKIVRMSHPRREGNRSIVLEHYLFGEFGVGVRHWTTEHVNTLFTREQYLGAFRRAGLTDIEWLPGWREYRDRVIAVKPAA
jgi:SAM-dependent methyltransferase